MRLPGTINVLSPNKIKAGRQPAIAQLIEFHDDRIYDLEDFPELEQPPRTDGIHYQPNDALERIRDALAYIPADDYDIYLRVGMAIKSGLDDAGFDLFRQWAMRSIKFNDEECRRKWASLKPEGGITLATLFGMARQHGWTDKHRGNGAGGLGRGQGDGCEEPTESSAWDNPDESILDDRRGDLPTFPVDILTPALREWVERAAHGAGVTADHIVLPLLSITSGLIGTARRVRASPAWLEPMSLWGAIIGFSDSGKTPALDVIRRALSRIERNRKEKIEELQRAHAKRMEVAKATQKKWKEEAQQAIANNQPTPDMPAEAMTPAEFVAPRLYVSDATIERIAVLLQARPRGLVVICDEMAGLFAAITRARIGNSGLRPGMASIT